MTTAPVVELRFNPTDLRPRDLPSAGAFLGSPSDAIQAGLATARTRMRDQVKAEVRGIAEPTAAQILRLADLSWQLFMPQYRKISAPVMADAYIRAYRAANAGDVPMSVIYDLAEKHAEKTGDYFHESSRDALADGFNTLVNRRVPAKAAADKVLDAYGLTPRQMRGYVNNKQLTTPIDAVIPLDVKGKSREYVDRSFTSRIKKLSEQEEHNINEQAKQFAWLWLQSKGRLSDKAQKMWITAKDERVCKVCGPLHGKKVMVGQQFKTKEGAFWSPGLHPNCRCVVRLIENKFSKNWEEKLHPRTKSGRFTKVGFTGTLKGMTPEQQQVVREELSQDALLSHGSATGADEQAATMANELGMYVVAHPADDVDPKKISQARAHLKRKPKPALDRNQDIVDQTDRLLAAPQGPEESYPRSGTWATIRRARKAGKPVTIVMPDGTVHGEAEGKKFSVKSRTKDQKYEITEDDQNHYISERCNDLAMSIHQKTGWPVWGVYTTNSDDEREEAWWHTGVITPDGQWLDVEGKRPLADVQDRWAEYLYEEGNVDLEPVKDFGEDDGTEVTERSEQVADALLAQHKVEKRFDQHQPRGRDGRWSGGQSKNRQLAHKVNALESPSAKVLQGEVVHRSAQAAGYLTQPRYLTTPLKHRDREMAQLARGASAWSRRGANVQRARKMAEGDNAYYAGKLSRTEKGLHKLITAVESAPANSPELYRGLVVSPEHLNDLKEGSAFTLPMSSFTESQPFSESFARKWGPMIAHAHAKREGKEAPGDMHPVVMVLEPKANALNISPLVSERQAEWITRGEFLITQVGDDSGLTVVHLKQTSNRISKADWDAEEHPRGGDPENKGRFSRRVKTLEAEKEKPLSLLESSIWESLKTQAEPEAEAEAEPETEGKMSMVAEPETEGKMSMVGSERMSMGRSDMSAKMSMVPEGKMSMNPDEGKTSMVESKKLSMTTDEARTKLSMLTTPEMEMSMRAAMEQMTMTMADAVPPKPRPLEVIDRPVLKIQDDNGNEYPVYAVIEPGNLNWGGALAGEQQVELNHTVTFTPSKDELYAKANQAFEKQIINATARIWEKGLPTRTQGGTTWTMNLDEDDVLAVVNWAAYRGRVADQNSHFDYDFDLEWVDRQGNVQESKPVPMSSMAKTLGVSPKDFDIRILRMDEGHDSKEGITVMESAGTKHGYEDWVTSGRYNATPVKSEEIAHNLAIKMFWIDPDVEETTIGWTGPIIGD